MPLIRRLLLSLLLIATVCGHALATINDTVLYYTADSADTSGTTITDRGSGGNNGTLVGSPGSTTGHIAQALTFNGTNQYIDAGSGASLNISGNITMAAWVNLAAIPGASNWANIISKSYDGSIGYFIDIQNLGTAQLRAGSFLSGSNHNTAINLPFGTGSWHHVVGIYDGTSWIIYIDGSSVGSTTDATGAVSSSLGLNVGILDLSGTPSRFLNGSLDEIRIYNRALSSTEVTALYNYTGSAAAAIFRRANNMRSGSRSPILFRYHPVDPTEQVKEFIHFLDKPFAKPAFRSAA